jgi:DNA-directed RNA polymerase specialized sigma subunit
MAERKRKKVSDALLAKLDSLKRLMILFLLKAGTTQEEIAMALDVDQSYISRTFPAKKLKKF